MTFNSTPFPEPIEEEVTRAVRTIQVMIQSLTGKELPEARARELFNEAREKAIAALKEVQP